MRIPLTKYGWPQVVIFPAVVLTVMLAFSVQRLAFSVSAITIRYCLPLWAIVSIETLLAIVMIWGLAFFRDPYRSCPSDKNLLLAPADGKITDIEIVDENDFIGAKALCIGIFLSIFDAHINRAPCNVKVEKITYKQGKYKNAKNPQAGRVNESNDLGLVRTDSPRERLIVRQISGAIARRIVCETSQEQKLTGGEKFGMIKFGSRTELYLPARVSSCVVRDASCVKELITEKELKLNSAVKNPTQYAIRNTQYEIKCLVQIGDKVKAGLTPLIRYEYQNVNIKMQS